MIASHSIRCGGDFQRDREPSAIVVVHQFQHQPKGRRLGFLTLWREDLHSTVEGYQLHAMPTRGGGFKFFVSPPRRGAHALAIPDPQAREDFRLAVLQSLESLLGHSLLDLLGKNPQEVVQ